MAHKELVQEFGRGERDGEAVVYASLGLLMTMTHPCIVAWLCLTASRQTLVCLSTA